MYTTEVKKLCIQIYNKIKSLRKVESLTSVSKSTISRWNLCKENVKKYKYKNKNKVPLIIDLDNFCNRHLSRNITKMHELMEDVIKKLITCSVAITKHNYKQLQKMHMSVEIYYLF